MLMDFGDDYADCLPTAWLTRRTSLAVKSISGRPRGSYIAEVLKTPRPKDQGSHDTWNQSEDTAQNEKVRTFVI
jgi:hypothetical protein